MAARAPIMALTEWPTNTTSVRSSARQISQHVGGVAVEGSVPDGVVGRRVGTSEANEVEEDDPVLVLEGRRDETPHVLVAPEPVGEHHRPPVSGGPATCTLLRARTFVMSQIVGQSRR